MADTPPIAPARIWIRPNVRVSIRRALFGVSILIVVGATLAGATPAGQVAANSVDYEFAEWLEFELEYRPAPGESAVEEVVLHYTVSPDGPWNRRIPSLEGADRTVTATHRDDLSRGQIPPSSEITWWWTLRHADGDETIVSSQSTTYLDRRFDWQSRDFAGVTVYWYGEDDSRAEAVASAARSGLESASELLGWESDRRVHVVAYANREDMLPSLLDRGETYEAQLTTLGARVAADIVLVLAEKTGERSVDGVLAHELAHIALHLSFEEDYAVAPLWLDEGFAMFNEGPLGAADAELLQQTLDEDRLLSVRSLSTFPGEAELVPIAYVESRDIVAYLIETHGVDRFRRLVEAVGTAEVDSDTALRQVYDLDTDALYTSYRAARGLGPPATPDPVVDDRREGPLPCAAAILIFAAVPAFARRPHSAGIIRPEASHTTRGESRISPPPRPPL